MKRMDVYKLIDSERDYQDMIEDTLHFTKTKTTGEWIVLINHYTTEMNKEWSKNKGDDEALEVMRKIAGIAVHCMEQHDTRPRLY